ncbi:MAG: SDR family NAD(P)-dependent oxidoreductase, partial [Candidatus Parabeggiatoa sp.]|nr:SDR family NAD(P)-dependent oxidoreductase [Candidatus Parabeggiatoa sp.]
HVDYCAECLKPYLYLDLRTVLYPESSQENNNPPINQTALSQPALFVIEYALAQLWMSWGIQPAAMIGHSIGEYVAACLAGVLTLDEALVLVTARGRLMQTMPSGTMLAVPLTEEEIRPLLNNNIDLAVLNISSQSVVSGPIEAVEQFAAQLLAERGLECQSLHTSHAFHSAMMLPILQSFLEQVQKVSLQAPQMPYLSNVTGTWIKTEEAIDPNYWVRHLRQTVRFADGLQPLVKESNYILLEVGPGRTLSTFAKRHPEKSAGQVVLTSLRHPKDELSDNGFLLNMLGQLWLAGVVVDWAAFYGEEQRQRLPLPTYPFEHQRYWIEPSKSSRENKRLSKKEIADWFYIPSWQRSTLPQSVKTQIFPQQRWLVFLDDCGLGAKIITRLKQAEQEVITVSFGQTFTFHNDSSYTLNPEQPDDYDALLTTLRTLDNIPTMIVHLWRVTANNLAESVLEQLDEWQNLGFYSLLFIAQALGKQHLTESIQISAVSNNMQAVMGEKWLSPEKATLLGAIKVIPQEYTHIRCRSVDVVLPDSEREKEQLIEQLLQELTSKFTDRVVAYRENYRWIPTFEPVRLEKTAEKISRLRERGVYLIIGGLGAIGLTLAEYLAKTVQARLILVGRSAFPPKKEWVHWLETHDKEDRVSNQVRKLQTFENWGAEVLVFSADVAHLAQMQIVIKQAEKQFGPIKGVINTAGVIDFAGVIHKRTRAMTESMVASKVKGTLVLDRLLQHVQLDFFVLGSSIGSIFYQAKFGQVGYAAASDFLDAFAYYKHCKEGTFTITIDWSDWQEIGMSVEAEKLWRKNHHKTEEASQLQNTLLPTEG